MTRSVPAVEVTATWSPVSEQHGRALLALLFDPLPTDSEGWSHLAPETLVSTPRPSASATTPTDADTISATR